MNDIHYRNHQRSVETLFTKVAATIDDCSRVLLKLEGTPSQRPKGNLPLIEDYRFSMECDGSFDGDMFLQGLDSYQGWMGALSGSWACSLRGGKGCVCGRQGHSTGSGEDASRRMERCSGAV